MDKLLEYLDYFINATADNYCVYMRVIIDFNPPFPYKNFEDIEFSKIRSENHAGWGKPNKIIGDVELFYLGSKFKILTFDEWKRCEFVNHPFYRFKN